MLSGEGQGGVQRSQDRSNPPRDGSQSPIPLGAESQGLVIGVMMNAGMGLGLSDLALQQPSPTVFLQEHS